ncbi:testis-expressed protein 264 [Kryptolebias marmoratus]|uniref:Testis expressed 264, ER-phagy receptor n=1 Tax=Kryptolebias marmoratus TaxID=37003 RepID=A0A3Q2ZZT2_KRYMA|nr:testis-expressed protein 264 [Kryptolebias marmoratus]
MPDDWLSPSAVLVLFLGLFILTLAGRVLYSGLLADVTVQTCFSPLKKITFAYRFKEGAYKSSGQLFEEARCAAPTGLSRIGVFYDDPKKIPGPLCRHAVGCILSEGENQVDEELLKRCRASGFNVFSFPEITHVVTTSIPHRAFFSSILRVRRVYPQLEQYIKERKLCAHPFLEIYKDGQIQFIVPLARQVDFYVPEVRQVERRLSEQEESHSDTDISGADSNSECSSESGLLLSDSRDTSPVESSVHSALVRDRGRADDKGGSSRGSSFKDLDWDWTAGRQDGDAKQESLDVPAQELLGVVEGEE